tara:strand:- start:2273 stop:2713 length:441 start_codon:yes stop_codon:yes gene_type:complete
MPTYFVNSSNYKIEKNLKEELAKKITKVHNEATGANKYFAQVIFNDTKKGDHFMGGKMVLKPEIFIYGHIRSGRTDKIKNKLIIGLRDVLKKNTRLKKDNIWVYILDLRPNQMIEYGEILPKSGGEKKWFKNLPIKLKKRLNKIDN